MALLKDTKGREEGGYTRLFGDKKLGRLLSRVQSTVIRAGAELERFIIELANTVDDADAFLDADRLGSDPYTLLFLEDFPNHLLRRMPECVTCNKYELSS